MIRVLLGAGAIGALIYGIRKESRLGQNAAPPRIPRRPRAAIPAPVSSPTGTAEFCTLAGKWAASRDGGDAAQSAYWMERMRDVAAGLGIATDDASLESASRQFCQGAQLGGRLSMPTPPSARPIRVVYPTMLGRSRFGW